jgi:hypothetical protein
MDDQFPRGEADDRDHAALVAAEHAEWIMPDPEIRGDGLHGT